MNSISENLASIRSRIAEACHRAGRDAQAITLVAVSKNKTARHIREAYDAGQKVFGENYVQEFLTKQQEFLPQEAVWHFIGHLQSNKVKSMLGKVALIQTVDKLSLAAEISKRAAIENQLISILIEINISGEFSKYGLLPAQCFVEIEKIIALPNLLVKGLMTIASPESDKVRAEFREMKMLFEKLKTLSPDPKHIIELSMGMSQDFEIAIEEGTTMIRVGTAIFGER
jgi:PLP dependent protein